MPARKRTGGSASLSGEPSTSARSSDRDEEYRMKRQRNNDAVKKTRAKSKETANERKKRVADLIKENQQLEAQIDEKKKHINTLKEILIIADKSPDQKTMIQNILEENSDEDDELA